MHSSKRNSFDLPISNNFAILKETPIIGLLPIFPNFTIFNTKISLQIQKLLNKSESTLSSFENGLGIATNFFGDLNSRTVVLPFLHNSQKMKNYLFSLPLTIIILISKTSVISLSPILQMIIIISIKVSTFFLL